MLGWSVHAWVLPDTGKTALSRDPARLVKDAFEDLDRYTSLLPGAEEVFTDLNAGLGVLPNVIQPLVESGRAWQYGNGYPLLVVTHAENVPQWVKTEQSTWVLLVMFDQS